MSERSLEAIKFSKEEKSLQILDQLALPYNTSYINIETIEDAYQAIKSMQVRGAPAIAIVGALALAVDTISKFKSNHQQTIQDVSNSIDYLISSRPTAVNLYNALNDIKLQLQDRFATKDSVTEDGCGLIYEYAVSLQEDDLSNNLMIGANGLRYIIETLRHESFKGPFSIMTICNTGSLATSGHGTALGIIRTAYEQLNETSTDQEFWLDQVFPCETRPYNQGAKLTSYELKHDKIPFTLICDNMVASLIRTLNAQRALIKECKAPVKFVIVGADRIVRNGDTANKIGTFQLATLADAFSSQEECEPIKFMVAAPKTTIDTRTETGASIVIEERPENELTTIVGPMLDAGGSAGEKVTVGIATPGTLVWNPAFDVTPYGLIDSIVTEDEAMVKDKHGLYQLPE